MSSLFDVFIGQTSLEEITSIRDNLNKLLNSRRGSLVHLPDYGLPDINYIYQELPYSLQYLKNMITELITRYEPRIKNVCIHQKILKNEEAVLSLEINATLKSQEKIVFNTCFISGGQIIITNS